MSIAHGVGGKVNNPAPHQLYPKERTSLKAPAGAHEFIRYKRTYSEICPDLVQRLKELVKILLEYHDGGADKLLAVLAALGDLDHVIAVVLLFEIEKVGSFAREHFFVVQVFILLFHALLITKANIKLILSEKQMRRDNGGNDGKTSDLSFPDSEPRFTFVYHFIKTKKLQMKKLTTLVLIPVLALILLMSSCSKADYSHNNAGTIIFTESGGGTFTYPSKSGMLGSTVSGINAFDGADQYNADNKIVIHCPIAAGTYTYDANGYPTFIELFKNNSIYTTNTSNGTASGGSVTVTINGSKATASFTGTVYNTLNNNDQVTITAGSYTGQYGSM